MSENSFREEQKEYKNAKDELTNVKVQVCMKALNEIGAVPLYKEERFRLEEELFKALEWF